MFELIRDGEEKLVQPLKSDSIFQSVESSLQVCIRIHIQTMRLKILIMMILIDLVNDISSKLFGKRRYRHRSNLFNLQSKNKKLNE